MSVITTTNNQHHDYPLPSLKTVRGYQISDPVQVHSEPQTPLYILPHRHGLRISEPSLDSGLAHYLTNPSQRKDLPDSLYFHFIPHTTFSLSGHFIIYYFCYLHIQVYNSSTQQGSTSFPLWIPCQVSIVYQLICNIFDLWIPCQLWHSCPYKNTRWREFSFLAPSHHHCSPPLLDAVTRGKD